jgi:hypothetical protein
VNYSPKKIIGVTMMVVGIAGCVPLLAMVLLTVLADTIGALVVAATLAIGLFAIACRLSHWRPPLRVILLAVSSILACAFGFYRFCTAEGVLAYYGVHFNADAVNYASPNLNTARFWFEGRGGRLRGPEVTGDLLVVEKPRRTAKGSLEFAVKTCVGEENNRVWIQLLTPPRGDQAFQVSLPEHSKLSVLYSMQKGSGEWP